MITTRTFAYAELSTNVVAFCRILRAQGFAIGPAEEADALRAIQLISIGDPEGFRLALRTVLTSSQKDLERFDSAFADYWLDQKATKTDSEEPELFSKKLPPRNQKPASPSFWNWASEEDASEEKAVPGYSPQVVVTKKDLSKFSEQDFQEATRIVRDMAKALSTRLSRRYKESSEHRKIDFRKTIHRSLRNAGELIRVAYRKQIKHKVKLVLLCDVSGSMEDYSRFLITFLYALNQLYGRTEIFAFSTALHRLTGMMKLKNMKQALTQISEAVPDWSGGTRIGESLQAFLKEHGRLLSKDSVVMILSDGWDIGDLDLTESSMKEIHQKAGRVIWLNPLLGSAQYQPDCAGMQTALKYVDDFLPAHNLESLQDLCNHLIATQRKPRIRMVQ